MSLRALLQGALPVTAPLVLNPLMAKMVEAAGFPAGYLDGGATGYQKVSLEANLNVTEMCQAAIDIHAVCSLPLILDGACGYGDPMHMLNDFGSLGYKIVADPSTPLLAAYAAWKKVYAELADGFAANVATKPDWSPVEQDLLATIDIEKLLRVERRTTERP